MCFKTITIDGVDYHFDSKEDHLLKRGLLDIYELSDNPDEWVVLDEYIFWSSRLQNIIIVPRWMVTDLASVPKGFRWLISVNERHRIPSLTHLEMILDEVCSDPTSYVSEAASYLANSVSDKHALVAECDVR